VITTTLVGAALIKAIPITAIKTSVPSQLPYSNTSDCQAGMNWKWDDVTFEFIYPFADTFGFGNDSCCVLRISNGKNSILLPGDIEKYAEGVLLNRSTQSLQATVLVAPHHGSKTSDLDEFVLATQPKYVIYATGYHNRYHFPHQEVIEKYKAINARQLNTVETGAIKIQLNKMDVKIE
jgi:competence protein ComEC